MIIRRRWGVAAVLAVLCACRTRPPAPAGDAKRGAELYARTCAVCHGASGEGYRADRAPALSSQEFLASVDDAYLRRAIADGRPGTTMSAWSSRHGGPLSGGDVDAVVAFLRSAQRVPSARLEERSPSGDAERGEGTFKALCAGCHGRDGTGGAYEAIGEPGFLRQAGNGLLRAAIRDGRPGTPMPAFAGVLGESGVEDVLAYLRGLQARPARPEAEILSPPIPPASALLNPGGPEPEGFRRHPGVTSADVIKAQLDRGARLAILDARAPADYAREHIAGAVSVPFYDPAPYLPGLPKDAWLVCYCACPHAESQRLAQQLVDRGFTQVTVLDEGLPYWKQKGYPTRAAKRP